MELFPNNDLFECPFFTFHFFAGAARSSVLEGRTVSHVSCNGVLTGDKLLLIVGDHEQSVDLTASIFRLLGACNQSKVLRFLFLDLKQEYTIIQATSFNMMDGV
jgi:hypothetical protein